MKTTKKSGGSGFPTVFYDGSCHLCARSVRFILKYDRKKRFRFASLQSVTAKTLEIINLKDDSVILYEEGKILMKSQAAIRIAILLGFPWSVAGIFAVIPVSWRDTIYDLIARNRHRWPGSSQYCEIGRSTPDDRILP
ncbi:MAG TPA: DCC1-like thiol-disulfide oxidoreductase family protein [Bacteroidales bacterium]|nr:DCC1-like thiol-disulfide oxidoreductase family protein [Bacteroidales bacterium]